MALNVKENIDSLFERLESFLKSKTVIGEEIRVGETTIIPIITVSFGLGSGGGDGTDAKGGIGVANGAGVGAKVAPTALIVVKGDNVEVLPIKRSGGLDKLIDMVPEIVSKFQCGNKKGELEEDIEE